jgi:hypothetical protein
MSRRKVVLLSLTPICAIILTFLSGFRTVDVSNPCRNAGPGTANCVAPYVNKGWPITYKTQYYEYVGASRDYQSPDYSAGGLISDLLIYFTVSLATAIITGNYWYKK